MSGSVTVSAIKADTVTAGSLKSDKGLAAQDVIIGDGSSVQDKLADMESTFGLPTHEANMELHITGDEHKNLKSILSRFEFSDTADPIAISATPPILPNGSLPWQKIREYFARNCQLDTFTAPGNVFVSRVPYATDTTHYVWSTLDQGGDVYSGLDAKIMDNAGLEHKCSTDTVENVDDYVGKHWAFWWGRCNYTYDEFGQKHITALKDISWPGHRFSDDKQTGSFGPAFWFFCKPELYQYTDGNGNLRWTTDTGEETGKPFTQLWGISDSRWSELSDEKRAELEKHGITIADFHIWPECLIWDKVQNDYVERPYWIHSAFCGGYGTDDITGEPTLVSKKNAVLRRNISYQNLNAIYGAASSDGYYPGKGRGGSANVNGFGMLFDIVKNATKDSQSIHYGMASNNNIYYDGMAGYNTAEAGYIFPVAPAGTDISTVQSKFQVNSTVYLADFAIERNHTSQDKSIHLQVGRVVDIREETFLVKTASETDLTEQTAVCLVLDPATVQPFVARSTVEDAEAVTSGGIYAAYRALNGYSLSGITDNVIGRHDGQCYSLTSGQHCYRVQGTEYMPGAWICAADTIVVKGIGKDIILPGKIKYIPTSSEYVVFTCPPTKSRRRSGSFTDFLNAGYEAIGIIPTTSTGWILNSQLSPNGVAYPVLLGGNSTQGTRDKIPYSGTNPVQFLAGGYLNSGASAGSSCHILDGYLDIGNWHLAARD